MLFLGLGSRRNCRSVLAATPKDSCNSLSAVRGVGPRRPKLPKDRLDAFPLDEQAFAEVDDEFDL